MKKNDLKLVALVAAGVMLAGYIMHAARDIEVINSARAGYN